MLTNIVKNKIISSLISEVSMVTNKKNQSVLILDDETLNIVSAALQYYDVLANGIALITNIKKNRDPMPDFVAVYYIFPTVENVKLINNDFRSNRKFMYKRICIFWATSCLLDKKILELIATNSSLIKQISLFYDFELGFGSYDNLCAHLIMQTDYYEVAKQFNNFQDNNEKIKNFITKYVARIGSLLSTLDCKPIVRFRNVGKQSQLLRVISESLEKHVSNYLVKLESKTTTANLLIVDRSIDVATLFAHDYSFQMLAYDLLKIPINTFNAKTNQTNHDSYSYTENGKQHLVYLDENLKPYKKYKNEHIAETTQKLHDDLIELTNKSETAKIKDNKNAKVDVQKALAELPEYTETIEGYLNLIKIAEKCMDLMQSQNIIRVGVVEQDIITGIDSKCKSVQPIIILETLAKLLATNSQATAEMKFRLLVLYFGFFNGIEDADKERIIKSVGLSIDLIKAIDNFMKLNIHSANPKITGKGSKHSHIYSDDQNMQKFYKNLIKSNVYETSRFVTATKNICIQFCNNQLSTIKFPYVSEKGDVTENHNKVFMLNVDTFDWDWESAEEKENKYEDIYILAMVGPVTLAEVKTIAEVTQITGKTIYLVGTHVISPSSFITELKNMSN